MCLALEATSFRSSVVHNKLDFLKETSDKRLKNHIGHYQALNTPEQPDFKMTPTIEKNLQALKENNKPEMGLSLGL